MEKNVILRDYQVECINTIQAQKPGKYLISLATGLGKTVTFANIPRQGRMLILSHRQELVFQPKKYFNCSYGIEMGGHTSNGEDVVSASVSTLIHRLDRFDRKAFDIIIVDECHHVMAPTYRKILNYFQARLVLGFTATANRSDHQMLGEVFEKIIFNRDLKWGIENGYLSPIKSYRVDVHIDPARMGFSNGDFDIKKVAKEIDTPERNAIIARAYEELAVGQTIIFCASVAHAYHLAEHIPDSVVVTSDTGNRGQVIKDFTDKKFRCLINCMVFTEGTDIPLIETVIIARPTASQSLYAQMVGRGLRLSEGKSQTVVIDCVGVSGKHNICEAPHLFNTIGVDSIFENPGKGELPSTIMKQAEPKLLPAYNASFSDVSLFTGEEDEEGSYIWFLTVKHRKSGQIVTKILYTDDIDESVYKVRRNGYSFVSCVGKDNAQSIVYKGKKKIRGIIKNHQTAGIKMNPVDFYSALLAILDEGKYNDNITEELMDSYLKDLPVEGEEDKSED